MIRHWPGAVSGVLSAALVVALTLGTLAAVALRAEGWSALGPADWAAVRFTLLQATLSALFSVGLAVPVARALARRQFPGRRALVTLMGAPFILPVIVAVLGLLAVFGRNGLISHILGVFGLPPVHIYGLHGVVLAHVFFNLPLATRLILHGWLAIPGERFRLAAALGFGPRETFRFLEWPMLRAVLPGAALVIFLICTTSFAVALALGGGPRATTVELAIYQAFRFEFDLGHAALLGLVQVVICASAAALARGASLPSGMGGGLDRPVQRWDSGARALRLADTLAIALAAAFLLTPLAAVVVDGLAGLWRLPPTVLWAAGRSLAVALAAAALTLALALPLAIFIHNAGRAGSALAETVAYLPVATSPLVIGVGLFIVIFPFADPVSLALPVTALVNAVMSLPFVMRAILPALTEAESAYGRLADSLGMRGLTRLRVFLLPRLARPLGFATGLAAALSAGDLGVIALFVDPAEATLPLYLYQLMGSYRMEEAAGAALLLLALSLGLFVAFDRGGRLGAEA
ncbi:MAG: thiamine/thiamine pyrophosphate ABC transporter permease ThiP [Alphaproteobacteria bacterium]|nr:MAG: thiamine/thiamine pyrophosphate ABC transporter permease ThiP [Alphaproteobacteria bacterium]